MASLRQYNNSNSPRLVNIITDGTLAQATPPTGKRVVVIGFCNNPTLEAQEIFPTTVGGADTTAVLNASYNIDPTTSKPYPSELSLEIEVLINSGVSNIQVINAGKSDRMRDMTARMARERFIAYENAYTLIADLPIDNIVACNVVAGLKGDGLYNTNTDSLANAGVGLEVTYDLEAYNDANTLAADKDLSTIPGFLKISDVALAEFHEKAPVTGGEDLVYQLTSICARITANGSLCTAGIRSVTAVELKYLTKVDFSASGSTIDFQGTESVSIAPNVWAFARGHNDSNAGGTDYQAITRNADVVLEEIEAYASMFDVSTGTLKAIYKETFPQIVAGSLTVTALDEMAWQIFYGSATTSMMQKWLAYLSSFGSIVDARLQQASASIILFKELDPVTSADREIPDNYLLYNTTNTEKPTSYSDATIIKDANGRNEDMGYLLDRVASNSVATFNFPGTTLAAKTFNFISGASNIVGMYNTLPGARASTKVAVPSLGELGPLSSKAASDLTRLGYQLLTNDDGVYSTGRDITAGLFISDVVRTDFINRLTTRILKDALDVSRIEGKKLLGQADSARLKEGHKQRLEQEFTRWAHPEDGRLRSPAVVAVFASSVGEVIGGITTTLSLAIANEILEVKTISNVT